MALPSSHPITLGQVCTEFGAPTTARLGLFVRGGSYVPNTTTNAGVPTAEPITLGDLLGAAEYTPMSGIMGGIFDVYGGNTWHAMGTATCSVSGGQGTKSYAFSIVGGDASHFRIDSTPGNQAQVSGQAVGTGIYTSQLKCTVTDDVTSIDVFGNLNYERF